MDLERRATKKHEARKSQGRSVPLALSKTGEAAQYLRVSEPTVREMIRTNRLHAVKVGRAYRIPREAIEAFLAGKDASA